MTTVRRTAQVVTLLYRDMTRQGPDQHVCDNAGRLLRSTTGLDDFFEGERRQQAKQQHSLPNAGVCSRCDTLVTSRSFVVSFREIKEQK